MSISFESSTPAIGRDLGLREEKRRIPGSSAEQNGFADDSEGGSPLAPRSVLIRVIEGEIIPRLFLAHCDRPQEIQAVVKTEEHADVLGDSEAFARLFLNENTTDIVDRLQLVIERGVRRERIYLDLLAPVARRLGIFWEDGQCTFDDMARGLSRVDQVVREINARAASAAKSHG